MREAGGRGSLVTLGYSELNSPGKCSHYQLQDGETKQKHIHEIMKERQGKKRYLTKIGEILKKQKQRKEKKSQQRIIKGR